MMMEITATHLCISPPAGISKFECMGLMALVHRNRNGNIERSGEQETRFSGVSVKNKGSPEFP
jgi:hypothetical protein